MRIRLLITSALLALLTGPAVLLYAQAPAVQWSGCYGGDKDDRAFGVQQTRDSGYILTGWTYSTNIAGTHTAGVNPDMWVERLDSSGKKIWEKSLGGTGIDNGRAVRQASDGGFVVMGSTESADGDVSKLHGKDSSDIWVVKLGTDGAKQWEKTYGSISPETGYSIDLANDGGYIVVGTTYAGTNGDVTGGHGKGDGWVIKLKANGDLDWQKCLGGSEQDVLAFVQATSDGGYIITGYTNSADGDVSGLHGAAAGEFDVWVVKLKANGDVDWQKCIGGTGWDSGNTIYPAIGGGYILVGYSASKDGDIKGYHPDANNIGLVDMWVARLKANGDIDWQKCMGGTDNDAGMSAQPTSDSGCVVAGYTRSNDADLAGVHKAGNGYDLWLLKFSATGTVQWQKCLGGASGDFGYAVGGDIERGFIVAGMAQSTDGDVTGNHGDKDGWLVKFVGTPRKPPLGIYETSAAASPLRVYPNPSGGMITLGLPGGLSGTIHVGTLNDLGQQVNSFSLRNAGDEVEMDLRGYPSGAYTIVVQSGTVRYHRRVVISR